MKKRISALSPDAMDFAPAMLKTQLEPPSPLPRFVLYTLLVLVGILLVWAVVGRLDVVAVAPGKLVPQSFLKVVQPADPGIVKEILVKEGDEVAAGQVLMRMDASLSIADRKVLETDHQLRTLQLRRIDGELTGNALTKQAGDDGALFAQVDLQRLAHRQAHADALATERAAHEKAGFDLKSAVEIESKLKQTLPIFQAQENGWNQLAKEGFAGKLMALDRTRGRIEVEQELHAQTQNIESLKAVGAQSAKRIAQITSAYQQQLHNERIDAESHHSRLRQELAKQSYKHGLLELRAPQAGIVKDLATHTPGTVVSPGTVLLTIVPHNEPLLAEIWVTNADSGFVAVNQKVKVKLEAYPFQKYGMLDGVVKYVTYDSADRSVDANADRKSEAANALNYRAFVTLNTSELEAQGLRYKLIPGMQVAAEIHLGNRSVIEYLLSPVRKTTHEAGRER